MNAQEFCYWLQGFMEVQNPETVTKEQVLAIKDHLGLVFGKITPDRTAKPATPSPDVIDLQKFTRVC